MATTRTTHPAPSTESAASAGRGPAAVIAVRRLFTAQSTDYMLVLGTAIFLVAFGLVMVLSSSFVQSGRGGDAFGVFVRQSLFAAIGIPVMLVMARLPVVFWRRWARVFVYIGLGLQVLVFIPGLSYEYGGNRNWISIGGVSAQPSEFLKLALVVWLASVLSKRADAFPDLKSVVFPALPISGVALLLVLAGGDLGTATIMIAIVFASLFFAGAPLRYLALLLGMGIAGAIAFALTGSSRTDRIRIWLDGCTPEQLEGVCWQPTHGMWALGSGGLLGQGLGNSAVKWSWLPHSESDYIFAIIGEELGLVGCAVVIVLFAVLGIGLLRIMRGHADPMRRIATGGVMVWIVGQAFVNIAVVLGMLPVLGVPLPLMSAGGSAMVANLMALGVVLSMARTSGESSLVAGAARADAHAAPARRAPSSRGPVA